MKNYELYDEIKLQVPLLVKTSGIRGTKKLRIHTVEAKSVVGVNDEGAEDRVEYDWLAGPTEGNLRDYESIRGVGDCPEITRVEQVALDRLAAYHKAARNRPY